MMNVVNAVDQMHCIEYGASYCWGICRLTSRAESNL